MKPPVCSFAMLRRRTQRLCTITATMRSALGISGGQVKGLDGIVALVERHKDDAVSVDAPFMVAVALKGTDEMVGEIVVMPNDSTISLGYTFSYRHHHKGYAFESLTVLIDLLHERYPQFRMYRLNHSLHQKYDGACLLPFPNSA